MVLKQVLPPPPGPVPEPTFCENFFSHFVQTEVIALKRTRALCFTVLALEFLYMFWMVGFQIK